MKQDISRKFAAAVFVGAMGLFGASAAHAALVLAVDVNDRSPDTAGDPDSLTQAGYQSYLLGAANGTAGVTSTVGVTQTLNGFPVTFATAMGNTGTGTIDDRDRDFSTQAGSTLTLFEVYDDFVFNIAAGGGLRLSVGNLAPSTQYEVSIYSYDHGSPGTRTARYVDSNNADATVLNTSFLGGTPPINDSAYKYTGLAVTDANGVLNLRGFTTSVDPGVFVSGFEINSIPEPTTLAALALAGLGAARRRRA